MKKPVDRPNRRRLFVALAALLAALALLALPAVRALLRAWEDNPVLRGRQLADEVGCHSCHLPFASVEIPNAGSRWGSVPRFQAGNASMYVESRAEIEEYIRFGAPRAWLDDEKSRARLEEQPVRMPAYGERFSDRQIRDLVAYAAAVEGVELPGDEAASQGRRIARKHGCLSCHGVEGAGGLPNPGSLGGFIPGFLGRNFEDLVEDEDEFREWILEGTSQRLERKAWVRFFWNRQDISMPAYRDQLSDEEVSHLWSWVEAIRSAPES